MTHPSGPRLELAALRLAVGRRTLSLTAPADLPAGVLHLVRGPSGAGKSSLLRALLGLGRLVTPSLTAAGDVTLHEGATAVPVLRGTRYHEPARRHMAFLPQAGALGLIDELPVMANLTLATALPRGQARREVETLARRFRLWPLPADLARASGGEKMRLSAVRALVPRFRGSGPPALLVADEPTAGLDPNAAAAVVQALCDVAASGTAVVVVVTHDPSHFVAAEGLPALPADGAIEILACSVGDHPVGSAAVVARFAVAETPLARPRPGVWVRALLDRAGAFALAPLAFVVGLLGLRPRLLRAVAGDALRTAVHPGTFAFVGGASLLVSVTISVFMFYLTPRRELIEPLILPDLLEGYGVALVSVVLPLFAAVFATAKNGAAGAARLAAAVRAGLLDTLALARLRPEAYALVPAVLGQTLSLLLATALSAGLGLYAGSMVFVLSGSPMTVEQVAGFMLAGVAARPHALAWLVAKTVVSGAVAGTVTAWFGLAPTRSERDVAAAVHRTLLASGVAVLFVQCAFVVAELG